MKNITKSNSKDEDADFGLSILDDGPEVKQKEVDTDGKLADSIARAFNDFTNRNNVNLRSFFSGVFSSPTPKLKKIKQANSEGVGFLTKEDLSADLSIKSKDDDFDTLHDDFFNIDKKEKDEEIHQKTVETNINKIPNKRVTKSLDNKTNSTRSEEVFFDDDDISLINNVTGIESLLEVYSAKKMIENWNDMKTRLSPGCRQHMGDYLRALASGQFWALKSEYIFKYYEIIR